MNYVNYNEEVDMDLVIEYANELIKEHKAFDDVLEDYNNRIPLKNLGICYEDVILKFMSVGLLPKNFLEVK